MPGGTTKMEMRNTFGLAATTASTPASKQHHPIVEKEERKYIFPTFKPGKYTVRHPQMLQ
jgi:hypothetical protein